MSESGDIGSGEVWYFSQQLVSVGAALDFDVLETVVNPTTVFIIAVPERQTKVASHLVQVRFVFVGEWQDAEVVVSFYACHSHIDCFTRQMWHGGAFAEVQDYLAGRGALHFVIGVREAEVNMMLACSDGTLVAPSTAERDFDLGWMREDGDHLCLDLHVHCMWERYFVFLTNWKVFGDFGAVFPRKRVHGGGLVGAVAVALGNVDVFC